MNAFDSDRFIIVGTYIERFISIPINLNGALLFNDDKYRFHISNRKPTSKT